MTWKTLIIGGIEIPLHAMSDDFSQDYDEEAGIGDMRLSDGSLVIQRAWPASGVKLVTSLGAAGSLPAPLDGLDRGVAHEVSCARHRVIAVAAPGLSVTLPAGRRSDTGHTPVGYAAVGGLLVPTALSIVGHVATFTAVAGAQHYQAHYWPKFSGRITHKASGRPWQAAGGWTMTIREV